MTGLPFTATVLNPLQCHLKTVEHKGRGVFGADIPFSAARAIPPQTVIEISPVLLFSKQEYDDHGKHTLLDHYTINCKDGRMALALGLGPSHLPAGLPWLISITRTKAPSSITRRTQTCRLLWISHGNVSCIPLRARSIRTRSSVYSMATTFGSDPVDGPSCRNSDQHESIDPWGGLADVQGLANSSSDASRNEDDIVGEDDLPFTWKKLALEKEEEQLGDIELGKPRSSILHRLLLTPSHTVQAWVVDIPDQTHIGTMLNNPGSTRTRSRISSASGDRVPSPHSSSIHHRTPQLLPPEPPLEPPYQLPVPCNSALTLTSLSLKNTFWPTIFTPKRKWEPEPWTRAKVRWASDAVRRLKKAYAKTTQNEELPVVAHVPVPYQDDRQLSRAFFAHDTRTTTKHPLRHAALDVIRQVADYRAAQPPAIKATQEETAKNGAQYLLTGLTLFITHEPCLMCTMALLHSRVKEVFYLVPMPETGGCGGIACVPSLKGVNHRFSIAAWKEDPSDWPGPLDTGIDV
ncbi:hypothetical protein J3R83DRAFT_12796 [Lanmaoa asiatica]|nr:hypothetical protein J3R83DRAFT_12796 [Lanmaoa asiatica]